MVYLEECASKEKALQREKFLKRYNHKYIKILISSTNNLIINKLKKDFPACHLARGETGSS